ncbi:MAG TPA: trimethylamine methyltransferase family protein [Actinomycetota bacterium]
MDTPMIELAAADDIRRIHDLAKRVLEEVGGRIMTQEARELLLDHGGTLEDEDLVKIPGDLVEQALERAPGMFTLYDREGSPAMPLGVGRTYVGAGVTNLNYLDPRDDTVKDFSLAFTAESATLADALTDIDFLATPGVTRPLPDLPLEIVNQWEFYEMTTHTTKPIMVLIAGEPELRDIYDMAELVRGGADEHRTKPFVIPYLNSVSPLLFNLETIEKLFLSADRGLPVCAQAAPQVAATGPSSIVGTCVVAAAETLMMLVLAQLRNPGTPFMSGTVPFLMDMRNGAVTAGGPDGVRFTMLMNQLCRSWGLPTLGQSFGGDSKTADEQAAMELTFYGMGTVLAGCDLVFDAGCIETGLLFSPELLVMSDEAAGMARRLVEPLDVSDELVAFDTIKSVGPGNIFLGEDHTLAHFRELWLPKMFSWDGRREWEEAGSKTMRERCREKVFQVWETHETPPLPDDVLAGMRDIIEKRRASIGG